MGQGVAQGCPGQGLWRTCGNARRAFGRDPLPICMLSTLLNTYWTFRKDLETQSGLVATCCSPGAP